MILEGLPKYSIDLKVGTEVIWKKITAIYKINVSSPSIEICVNPNNPLEFLPMSLNSSRLQVKSPHVGKPLGGFGCWLWCPSLITSAIPSTRWASMWQCRYQNPEAFEGQYFVSICKHTRTGILTRVLWFLPRIMLCDIMHVCFSADARIIDGRCQMFKWMNKTSM